jgi:hypothetical protein
VTNIIQYIENQGPMLSGELEELLIKTESISKENARKRIQRLKSPIHKLKGFFSASQSLLYHSDTYNSEIFFTSIKVAFEKAGKRYSAIVTALIYHGGIIAKRDLANYSFSPIKHTKGHVTFESIIKNLQKLNILVDYDDNHYQLNSKISSLDSDLRYYKAIEFSKNLLLQQFNSWARNVGIVSFAKGDYNTEVSNFQFAYTAPTYINGLVQYKDNKPKPGFLVADILLGKDVIYIKEVEFLIQKIKIIRAINPSLRLFPVFITEGVEVNAFNSLKKLGVMVASIKEIFGENYYELLNSLINTIVNAGSVLKTNPEKYIELMLQLTKLVDGKTNNLRGDLFELAVGYYYGQTCKYLEVGKKVRIDGEFRPREIDVFAIYSEELKLIECKGYNYAIDDEYILSYLNEKIPALKRWLDKSTFTQRKYTFEIWSTGGFTENATNLLEKAKMNTKKYSVNFLNKKSILDRANELSTNKFVTILKDYYFKEIV